MQIEEMLRESSLLTINTKIEIDDRHHENDLFVKLGWADGRWVWVDLTVARYTKKRTDDESSTVAELRRRLINTNRRLLEIVCIHATELLQSDERTLGQIVETWKGTQFEPAGTCEAIRTEENLGRVTSPLDAAAKLIIARIDQWKKMMRQAERVEDVD